ncbi:MAG: phosphoadenosine phosphosulfate reductase family protein, partial [Anaerobutyricum soehngenii]
MKNYIPQKASSIEELIKDCPKNQVILDNLIRAWAIINNPKYRKILCSISGGSDSDIMLDIVWKCDKDNKVDYVWFDTGLEYQATKDHLKYLEEKYNIKFICKKAIKPIPIVCKEY